MTKKQKLELTWIGKENRPKLEPRILVEDPEKSCHAKFRTRANRQDAKNAKWGKDSGNLGDLGVLAVDSPDIFDNRLIFGDNLLALKALELQCDEKHGRFSRRRARWTSRGRN